MADSTTLERFLAEQTRLSQEEVAEIYRAGVPWPILYRDLEDMAKQDARAASVPLAIAEQALNQLLDLEGAHMTALTREAERAVARHGGISAACECPEVQACFDHPIMHEMVQYSERVALRVGVPETWKVFAIYAALLHYAWEHPEWDPAG